MFAVLISAVFGTASAATVNASFASADTIPVTAASYTATGNDVNITLGFAPVAGASLTVVKNTGLGFIQGTFGNLTQGQVVELSHNGRIYPFVADYFGGSGNDLVLWWKDQVAAAWGSNSSGQLGNNSLSNSSVGAPVRGGSLPIMISMGYCHSLALCSDGTVAAWGRNNYGQLGNNSTTDSTVPVLVSQTGVLSARSVTSISAGYYHSLALCSDGTVAAWGYNSSGQLGNNSTTGSSDAVLVSPTGVLSGKTVVAVAAGGYHSLALCSDGTVAAWGNNSSGQLGNNSTINSKNPVLVSQAGVLSGKTVVAVSAGYSHSLALCSDGTVAAWGGNSFGQLGNGSTTDSRTPDLASQTGILSGKTVVAVAAGYHHSLVLCSDGTVAAWGRNNYGQLGNNSTTESTVPVLVSQAGVLSGKTVVAVAAGYYHSLALCSDGAVAAWGYNSSGQLGNNSTTGSTVPVLVSRTGVLSGKTVVAVKAGYHHSLALCSDGTLAAWGANYYGQLGNNSATDSTVPIFVSPTGILVGKTVVAVSAGLIHSLALCSDGTVAAWGENYYGQLGNNSTTNSTVPVLVSQPGVLSGKTVVAITAGSSHSLALCSDGTVAAWGANPFGQLGNNSTTGSSDAVLVSPTGVLSGKTVVAIAAGYYHSLALCSDGAVAAWGYNSSGQLGNNSTTGSTVPVLVSRTGVLTGKTVVAVSAGGTHSLAPCADGTVAAWGSNASGQLGNNSTTNSTVPVLVSRTGVLSGKMVVAVSAGKYHSLALCSDGTVAAWGDNSSGQLGNYPTTSSSLPVRITQSRILNDKAISAGSTHNLYLVSAATQFPTLFDLSSSAGTISPAFSPTTTSYTASVPNSTASVTITPTVTDPTSTVTVNGNTVASGTVSPAIPLSIGNNTITVLVTAQDGTTTKTYTIQVTRISNVATLSGLASSAGALSPTFSSSTTTYTASVSNATASVTVTPTVTDPTATVKVNGASVPSDSASAAIPLSIGGNTVTVLVTAQDGTTTKTYTVILTRAAPSAIDTLSGLSTTAGTLVPAFSPSVAYYAVTVPYTTISTTVNASAAEPAATLKVNGTTVTSGAVSQSIGLAVGANTISVVVTAPDGTTRSYHVVVSRSEPNLLPFVKIGLINNATDSTGYGSVSYAFAIGKHEVTNSQYAGFLNAKAKTDPYGLFNGSMSSYGITRSGSSGNFSYPVTAGFGNRPVVFVSWFDAARFCNWISNGQGNGDTETGVYPLNGTMSTPVLANAASGVRLPTESEWYKAAYYNGVTRSYSIYPNGKGQISAADVNFWESGIGHSTDVGSYAATPSACGTFDQGGNVWEWNDAVISSADGIARGLRGGSFDNGEYFERAAVRPDFGSQTREEFDIGFRVARTLSSECSLLSLHPESGMLVPAFQPQTLQYAIAFSHSTTALALVPTAADPTATLQVNGSGVISGFTSQNIPLSLGANTITVIVTAQDGLTTKTYTVTVTRSEESFADWISGFQSLLDKTAGGDPDHDGCSNLIEYVLGGNPAVASASPGVSVSRNGGTAAFVFVRRASAAGDTTQIFQYGSGLNLWTDIPIDTGSDPRVSRGTLAPDGTQTVTITVPIGGNSPVFGRLKVTK